MTPRYRNVVLFAFAAALPSVEALAGDWASWRGPEQVGRSREKAVVTQWSEGGENLLWKVPIGGEAAP